MPAKSKSQQRLFGAAIGGANFPEAQKIRQEMSTSQIRDFAATPRTGLPKRIGPPRMPRHHAQAGLPRVLGGKQA